MKVLITGGAGFIGSTIASACLDAGHPVVIVDDLSTGAAAFTAGRPFYHGDIAYPAFIDRVFAEHPDIGAVVHCAAHIVVPESVREPLRYYRNNLANTVDLLTQLHRHHCRRLIFSSSAAIYRPPPDLTVDETSAIAPTSPYGRTKAMVEDILQDAAAGLTGAITLRYFNPVGADPLRRTGPQQRQPSHALGKLITCHRTGAPFTIYGTDWPTRDGTAIRDYIHIWDLARAHVRALERFDALTSDAGGHQAINLGTTVAELVGAFEQATGRTMPVINGPRRPGDTAGCHSRIDKAQRLLGWRPRLSLDRAIRDSLAWDAVRDVLDATTPLGDTRDAQPARETV